MLIDGHEVRGVGTERSIIFQEPRLLPWLTVLGNVSFGLAVRGVARDQAEERAAAISGWWALQTSRRPIRGSCQAAWPNVWGSPAP